LAPAIIDASIHFRGSSSKNLGGSVLKKLGAAMIDRLIGSAADWIAIWRSAIGARGLTHREVDDLAGWGEGYCSKLLCGDREPTATTISRMNCALGLKIRLEVDRETSLTP
jgi:hypothetical protein